MVAADAEYRVGSFNVAIPWNQMRQGLNQYPYRWICFGLACSRFHCCNGKINEDEKRGSYDITCLRVTTRALITVHFLLSSTSYCTFISMTWDRVIQDSDDEEPLVEDDFSTSIAGHHPIGEQTTVQNANPEPQLSVDFDDFLQSPDMVQPALSSSQQRREERWISWTSGSGGGSIGE